MESAILDNKGKIVKVCEICENPYDKTTYISFSYSDKGVTKVPKIYVIRFHNLFGAAADLCPVCYSKILESLSQEEENGTD